MVNYIGIAHERRAVNVAHIFGGPNKSNARLESGLHTRCFKASLTHQTHKQSLLQRATFCKLWGGLTRRESRRRRVRAVHGFQGRFRRNTSAGLGEFLLLLLLALVIISLKKCAKGEVCSLSLFVCPWPFLLLVFSLAFQQRHVRRKMNYECGGERKRVFFFFLSFFS